MTLRCSSLVEIKVKNSSEKQTELLPGGLRLGVTTAVTTLESWRYRTYTSVLLAWVSSRVVKTSVPRPQVHWCVVWDEFKSPTEKCTLY